MNDKNNRPAKRCPMREAPLACDRPSDRAPKLEIEELEARATPGFGITITVNVFGRTAGWGC
jgi:hypothetical protein